MGARGRARAFSHREDSGQQRAIRDYVEDAGKPRAYWKRVDGVWMERRFAQFHV
jgi:hypothetical protein